MRTLLVSANAIFLAVVFFCLASCSKKNENEAMPVINPTVNPIPYSVMVYLITPTDKTFDPGYYNAAKKALLNIQGWYKAQMGNNKTFVLNPVVVDTITGLHQASWYNSNNGSDISGNTLSWGYYNTKYEMQQLLGPKFDTAHFTYFVYVAAPLTDETIPKGLAAQGSTYLEGLMGNSPDYFRGCAAHSLGHAIGLEEPQVQDSHYLMSSGFGNYPTTFLSESEKDSLNASPFFQLQ